MNEAGEHDRRRLPVEPLSEASWARIGARLQAQLDRGVPLQDRSVSEAVHVRGPWAVASGLAAAAAVLVAILVGGEPEVANPPAPQHVVAGQSPRLAHAGDAEIELAPHASLTVRGEEAEGYAVHLESGRALFTVPPRDGRPAFRVRASGVEVEVVGTRFSVESGERVVVEVLEGTVRVHWPRGSRSVSAGQRWSLAVDGPKMAPPSVDDSPPETEGETKARGEARAQPERATEAPPSRDERATPARGGHVRRAGPEDEAPAAADETVPATPTAQQRFEAAAALEAQHPERALTAYLQLADEPSPWASNALFAAARLRLEVGQTRGARTLLRRYLRRYPRGPNAADARTLLERAQ